MWRGGEVPHNILLALKANFFPRRPADCWLLFCCCMHPFTFSRPVATRFCIFQFLFLFLFIYLFMLVVVVVVVVCQYGHLTHFSFLTRHTNTSHPPSLSLSLSLSQCTKILFLKGKVNIRKKKIILFKIWSLHCILHSFHKKIN